MTIYNVEQRTVETVEIDFLGNCHMYEVIPIFLFQLNLFKF
jgi:hypothetical protein